MFFTSGFYYNNKYSYDYDLYIVKEELKDLEDYSMQDNTLKISIACLNPDFSMKKFDDDLLEFVFEWFMDQNFNKFRSIDNYEYIYLLKCIDIKKRFNKDMEGILDITFESYDEFVYKENIVNVKKNTDTIIYNQSNVGTYKPKIILNDFEETVIIQNQTTNKILEINNVNTNLIIDNSFGVIKGINNQNYIKDSNRNWLELKKGKNIVNINCNGVIKSLFPIRR